MSRLRERFYDGEGAPGGRARRDVVGPQQQCRVLDGLVADVRAVRSRRWSCGSAWPDRLPLFVAFAVGQGAAELVAGADVELGEDLVQVVFDGARAHEQLGSDLGVGQALAGQPGDLSFAGSELGGDVGGAVADPLAGGPQLARGSFGEPIGSHPSEHLVRGAQLLAGVDAATLATQPLAVEQIGAGELDPEAGAAEPVDRLAVA